MLFNSIEFAIFLPLVFLLYWFVAQRNLKFQNALLVVVSYVFYGWWDWRFLSLIAFSSAVDYLVGLGLMKYKETKTRKLLLLTSILVNLGFLGFFKYFNFFAENFAQAFTLLGQHIEPTRLNVILPVGISFYTFQTLSYSIDVYKKKLEPTKDVISFFAFVSFFPQLVAGPIERASNLLPQFYKKRQFDYAKAVDGMYLIFKGLFKKVVIADNLVRYVDTVFADVTSFQGFPLFWAIFFFTFQIYCDFSGYSDIAIGTARLFGFKLMTNFKRPYLASGFKDFWSRWHISLSTWFADYVYKPLGGNRKGRNRTVFNKMATFVLSGFWHGANWTFLLWGVFHGILLNLFSNIKVKPPKLVSIIITFFMVVFTWVFFRAQSISDISYFFQHLLIIDSGIIGVSTISKMEFIQSLIFVFVLLSAEINTEFSLVSLKNKVSSIRLIFMKISIFIILIYLFGSFENQDFIYFQF